jgi:hypothetical protein
METGRGVMLSYASKTLAVPVEDLATQEFQPAADDTEVGRTTLTDARWVEAPSSERDARPAPAPTSRDDERAERPSNPWGEPAFSLDELCESDGASAELKILALPVDVRSIADDGATGGDSAETRTGANGEHATTPSEEHDIAGDRAARRSATIRWFELPPAIAAEIAEHDPGAPPGPFDSSDGDATTAPVDAASPVGPAEAPTSADVTKSYETPGSSDLDNDPE